jgi:3-hydroxymyristoyl/3-hydroxydecanoyl-(acyl carrier protein) dehydratase
MTIDAVRCIPVGHPSLAGHFPGDPIVPGVVLLDEVFEVLRTQQGPCRLAAVPTVKFLAPLRPGQAFIVRLERGATDARVKFECRLQDRVIAQGLLEISDSG